MIRSMTGFGRGEVRSGPLHVGVEIRSVNHRHSEVRVKVPASISSMEEALRQRLAAAFARGRVDATVNVSGLELPAPIEVNHALIAAYVRIAKEVAERHELGGSISLETALGLPGAVSLRGDNGALNPAQKEAVDSAFEMAVEDLQKSRAREGKHLAADVEKRLRAVEKHRAAIARQAKGLPVRYAKRLRARVDEIEAGRSVDPARLAQEVAILASRSDITEELVRLGAHVAEAIRCVKDPKEPAGKKLDFILQEMHREANTINSKAEDLEIGRGALAIKAEVEKLREQAQNLE
jgi:uncharacterized protein (TIGR00255 family)